MLLRSCPLLAVMAIAALGLDPARGWGQDSLPLIDIAPATQTAPVVQTTPANSTLSPQTYPLIHVNATVGHDSRGDGSQLRPYQTITHALEMAPPNSVVVLGPGEYSAASGEEFPIYLKAGVTIQGSPGPGMAQAIIRGSGVLPSAAGQLMAVTIVGVEGAGLGNVTVTNTATSGYGLVVVEGGSPIIRNNRFIDSGYGGVYVAGPGTPLIENNYFSQNGVVGLVIGEQSTAQVQGNLFENTGTGIRVAPGAQPYIANNRIVQNQDGLVLDSNAQPRLQNNVIAQNRRNGLIEFQAATKADATAPPTLVPDQPYGTATPPAALRQNRIPPADFAVEAVLPRTGNGLSTPPVLEPPLNGSETRMTLPPPPNLVSEEEVTPEEVTPQILSEMLPFRAEPASQPSTSRLDPLSRAPQAEPDLALSTTESPPAPEAETETGTEFVPPSNLPTIAVDVEGAEIEALPISTPIVAVQAPTPGEALEAIHARLRQQRQSGPEPTPGESLSVPLQVIPPPVEPLTALDSEGITLDSATPGADRPGTTLVSTSPDLLAPLSAPGTHALNTEASRLQVPGGNIPIGQGGNTLLFLEPGNGASTPILDEASPPPPPSRASMLGLMYRVLVPTADIATQNKVREAVPDAFRVSFNDQAMMQVGAYADQATAEARAVELIQQGLAAQVVYIP